MKNSRGAPKKEERLRSALEMTQAPEAKEKKQKEKTEQRDRQRMKTDYIKGRQKE